MVRKFSFFVLAFCLSLAGVFYSDNTQAQYDQQEHITQSVHKSYIDAGFQNIGGTLWLNTFTGEFFSEDSVVSPMAVSASAVAVFVAGLLIGWIIDGVITYATGRSPSEWVAYMTAAAVDLAKGFWYGAVKLFVNQTTKKITHAQNSAGCFSYEARATHYICPMRMAIVS